MKRTALFLLSFLLLVGCSSTIDVRMTGQSDMNSGGNAAVVQIYQLRSEGNFMEVSYRNFWQDDGALGSILVGAPQRQTLYPNETKRFTVEPAEPTRFIGVAANFRNPDEQQWRALFPLEEVGDRLTVTVYSNRISAEGEGGSFLTGVATSNR